MLLLLPYIALALRVPHRPAIPSLAAVSLLFAAFRCCFPSTALEKSLGAGTKSKTDPAPLLPDQAQASIPWTLKLKRVQKSALSAGLCPVIFPSGPPFWTSIHSLIPFHRTFIRFNYDVFPSHFAYSAYSAFAFASAPCLLTLKYFLN